MAAAQRLVARGFLLLGNVEVLLEPVAACVVFLSVYPLHPYVSEEEGLVQVLAQNGRGKAINHATFRDRADVRTDTRVVKMEMSKPVPNLVHIQGPRVMVDHHRLRRVCSRCGMEGHIGPPSNTPRCDRCGVLGHATAGCTAPCQRCGHGHATTDCVHDYVLRRCRRPTTQEDPPTTARSEVLPPSPS
ncbi:hypothetical protein HPB47_007485 [Ixodes persulcatus]|uniref:Uncharacterized protein n=1 Tax=Ixodes persulcatus TaxID=34615 RepID=A0AC60P7I6_IXOPE|nr:hypothetical protein HPB47_007485 [Ixodes persulcatus]